MVVDKYKLILIINCFESASLNQDPYKRTTARLRYRTPDMDLQGVSEAEESYQEDLFYLLTWRAEYLLWQFLLLWLETKSGQLKRSVDLKIISEECLKTIDLHHFKILSSTAWWYANVFEIFMNSFIRNNTKYYWMMMINWSFQIIFFQILWPLGLPRVLPGLPRLSRQGQQEEPQ